jgi:hypothetical protein
MKRSLLIMITLIVLLFSLSGCLSDNTVLLDTTKEMKSYNINLDIIAVGYYEEGNVFMWMVQFYDSVSKKDITANCSLYDPPEWLSKIILSGNYKLQGKVFIDINKDIIILYPKMLYSNKQFILDIIKINPDGQES